MNPRALNATAATRVRLVITAFILIGLLLAAGVACGGNDDASESGASAGNDGDRDSTASSGDGGDRESGRSRDSGPALSVQNLRVVPNVEYSWVAMLDVGAFFAGDPPGEIMSFLGVHDVGAALEDASDNRDEELVITPFADQYGIPVDDVETVTLLGQLAFVLKGDFNESEIRNALNKSEYWTSSEGPDNLYYNENQNGAAFFPDDGYLLLGDGDAVHEVFDSLGGLPPTGQGPDGGLGETGLTLPGRVLEEAVFVTPSDDNHGFGIVLALRGDLDFDRLRSDLSSGRAALESDSFAQYWFLESGPDEYGLGVVLNEYDGYVLLGEYGDIGELLGVDGWTGSDPAQGWREIFGISVTDVDTGIHLSGEFGEAYALQGSYDPAAVESALNSSEEFELVEAEGIEYAAWKSDEDTAAIIGNQVYVVNDEFVDSRESFLDPVAQADSLLKYPEHPFVRVLDKAGTGWLLAAWDGPWYCDYFDLSGCLAMALAASTGDDSTVEVSWAILFDSEEAARAAGQVALEKIAGSWMVRSVVETGPEFEIETDGEFVIIEVSVSAETAAEFLDMLLAEGPLSEGPLRR